MGKYKRTRASELSRLYPRSLFLLNIIGVVNNKLGNFKEAIKSYEKALSIKPDLAEAYYNIGIALHNNGNSNVQLKHTEKLFPSNLIMLRHKITWVILFEKR